MFSNDICPCLYSYIYIYIYIYIRTSYTYIYNTCVHMYADEYACMHLYCNIIVIVQTAVAVVVIIINNIIIVINGTMLCNRRNGLDRSTVTTRGNVKRLKRARESEGLQSEEGVNLEEVAVTDSSIDPYLTHFQGINIIFMHVRRANGCSDCRASGYLLFSVGHNYLCTSCSALLGRGSRHLLACVCMHGDLMHTTTTQRNINV